jgi:hypothetical protein
VWPVTLETGVSVDNGSADAVTAGADMLLSCQGVTIMVRIADDAILGQSFSRSNRLPTTFLRTSSKAPALR